MRKIEFKRRWTLLAYLKWDAALHFKRRWIGPFKREEEHRLLYLVFFMAFFVPFFAFIRFIIFKK